MPTILTLQSLRVVIYSNDHRPAHVHVIGRGCETVFVLSCPHGPPQLRENYGYARQQLNRIVAALLAVLTDLCWHWRQIHGPDR